MALRRKKEEKKQTVKRGVTKYTRKKGGTEKGTTHREKRRNCIQCFFWAPHKGRVFLERRERQFNAATHLWISCGNPWPSSNNRVSSLPLPLVLPVLPAVPAVVGSFPQARPIGSCLSPSQRSSIGLRWHRDGQSILGEGRVRQGFLLLGGGREEGVEVSLILTEVAFGERDALTFSLLLPLTSLGGLVGSKLLLHKLDQLLDYQRRHIVWLSCGLIFR